MNGANYKQEYINRIYRLQDYIENNLYETHTLEELAGVSGFSKYHFHRIFKSMTKETVFQYATRTKLEFAASTLVARPDLSITDVAYQFGFSDSAVFSRTFKKYYDMSPRELRKQYSNNCKDSLLKTSYTKNVNSNVNTVKGDVEIITMDSLPVIYIRKIGAYKDLDNYLDSMEKLFTFAIKQNLIDEKKSKPLAVYHSHPDFSDEEKQRTSICLSVKEPITIDDKSDIGYMSILSGTYAVAHFEIFQSEYPDAWDFLCGEWLPQSGYFPRDYFPFEVYMNDPDEHPQHKHIVDIYLPIEPLF